MGCKPIVLDPSGFDTLNPDHMRHVSMEGGRIANPIYTVRFCNDAPLFCGCSLIGKGRAVHACIAGVNEFDSHHPLQWCGNSVW